MRLAVEDDYEAMSRRAADVILAEVRQTPELTLIVASGATPTRTYALLGEASAADPGLFRRARFVALDEWGGLGPDDPASCEAYLRQHLIAPLRVSGDRYLAFRTAPEDPDAECNRVRDRLASLGRVDLCVLGIGTNGHLGLNEPGELLQPFAHVAALSAPSLRHPMLETARRHVTYGMTLGMAEILAARRVLLLASGPHKRVPLLTLSTPRISTQFPASFLWLHPDVVCLCDRDAGARLSGGE
jgi:galactosamine-6-phosphate isomerase